MQARILTLIAMALTVLAVAALISMPQAPIPPEDAAFMSTVIEANTIGLTQARTEELQNEIDAYNAKRGVGGKSMPPSEF